MILRKKICNLLILLLMGSICSQSLAASYSIPPVTRYPITGQCMPGMARFDNQFSKLLQYLRIPGGTIAIVKNGKVLCSQGFGWSNLAKQQKMQPNTVMPIASVSKLFTAIGIMQLVQSGKLNLNQKVFSILNTLKPLPGSQMAPGVNNITVGDLLRMSGGWEDQKQHIYPERNPLYNLIQQQLQQGISPPVTTAQYMMSIAPSFTPGSSYSYSNMGYLVLGLVLDKVSGQALDGDSFLNYIKRHILTPLDISDVRAGNSKDYLDNYTGASFGQLQSVQSRFVFKTNVANGGLAASAVDMAKMMDGLMSGKLVSKSILTTMLQKPENNPFWENKKVYFGVGMLVRSTAKGYLAWKDGDRPGIVSFVQHRPDGYTWAFILNRRVNRRDRVQHKIVQMMSRALSQIDRGANNGRA